MADRTVKVDVNADAGGYIRPIRAAAAATDDFHRSATRIDGKTYKIRLKYDIDGDPNSIRSINRLENKQYRIGLHVDRTGASTADIVALSNALRLIPPRVGSNVNVNTKGAMGGVSNLAAAIAALGPVALSAGAVAGAGLGALTTVASAAGVGALSAGLAFKGMGDAVSAVNAYALEPTAENAKKMEEALRGLTREGQSFARAVAGMRPQLDALRATAQRGLLPGAEEGLRSLTGIMPQFNNMIARSSEALGRMAAEGGRALNSPFWKSFFDFMAREAPPILEGVIRSIGYFTKAWAGLSMEFAPVARDMVAGLESMMKKFADWSTTLDTNQGFQEFIAYARENGPAVMQMIGAIADALMAMVQAGMPIGAQLVPIITDLAEGFASLMRSDAGPVIMGIVAALGALKLASTVATGIMGLAGALGTFAGGAGGAGGAAAGLASKIGLIGIAAAAAVIAYDSFNTSAGEAATALLQGGEAAASMRTELAANDAKHREYVATMGESMGRLREWMTGMLGTETTTKQANDALREQIATMAPLAAAQANATLAQSEYDQAVVQFGRNSPQAIDAMRRLGEATANVKLEQATANQSGMAYYQTLSRIAQGSGAVADAATRVASGLKFSELSAMGATVKINGMGQAIATLPNGKQIPITADTGNANTQIMAVATQIDKLPVGKTIRVEALSDQAQAQLRGIGLEVRALPDGSFEVTANTEGAKQRLNGIGMLAEQNRLFPLGVDTGNAELGIGRVQDLAGTPRSFDVNALTGGAMGAIGGVQGQARQPQTFPHNANTAPASGNVGRIHDMARQMQVFPHDANTGPAAGAVGGIHGVARQGQTFPTDSNTSGAAGAVGNVQSDARRPQSFNTNTDTGGASGALSSLYNSWAGKVIRWTVSVLGGGRAAGGPVNGYAEGGPIQRAANGLHVRSTRTLSTGRLAGPGSGTSDSIPIMAANGEWVIRRRIAAIQGAGKMAMLNAGLADIVPRTERFSRAVQAAIPRTVTVPRGVSGSTHNGDVHRGVTANVTINNPRPERGSDSFQRGLSRMSQMGMFADA